MKYEFIPKAPKGMELTDILRSHTQFPGACMLDDHLLVHGQAYCKRHDRLEVGMLCEGGLHNVQTISGPGEVLYPVSLSFGGAAWYAWSETTKTGWSICVRSFRNGSWSDLITVDEAEAVLYPCLFSWQQKLYLLWTRQGRNCAAAVMCPLDEAGVGAVETVSVSPEVYRANACEGGDGKLYLTYDAYINGAYHTLARVRTENGWSEELQLDRTDEWTCASRVIPALGGATVCWYTFGYGARFSVCSADLRCNAEALIADAPETISTNVGWYMDLHAAGRASDGFQVLTYTWSKDAVQVRYRRAGTQWSKPAHMSYEDKHCCVHPFIFLAGGEDILLLWQFSHRNGHYDRNSAIVLTRFDASDIDRRGDESRENATNNFTIPIQAEKHLDRHPDSAVAKWLKDNSISGKLLFGDIHGQSNLSDGMGFIDQYYRRSRDKADLQFSCLTDHDCYPDWISQSEWELMRTTAKLMNTDNELTVLLSFEWTPNEYEYDFGHKNVYFRDDNGDIFRSGDSTGITPTDLYATLKRYRAICIPHHPAADWGSVSAATDWAFHDDKVERLVEIMSRHAPYEDYESVSKYTKNIKKMKGHSVQDALARGHRMGFTAGSDSHQMEHGVEGGIVAVFTPTHDREGIWDAMYDRRTYGATGARILVNFQANGHMMGAELTLAQGREVHFVISVLGTAPVRVDLLRNNQVIQTWEPGGNRVDAVFEDVGVTGSDWYYLRVTQLDDHMAWSSPIWIDRV